ncbi:aminoglycoside phosphotransferase family protein [Kocuria atrinae]|uniref:Aminoglycoside phosphotransferase domain-containing protein n=1 Tax=Kocuria atrinae TaxID=592377 RepID=A0ABN2XML9_9MICC
MSQALKTPVLNALYAQPGSEADIRSIATLVSNTGMAQPVIEHLRFKPETSAVARVVDGGHSSSGAASQPWWFAAYAPSETNKAGKLLKRADQTGYPLFTTLLPDDPRTSVFCGPIGLDRMLFKALAEAKAVDSHGYVDGTVLSYNPWRRVVFKRDGVSGESSVVRVWAEPPATAPFLSALHQLGAPVLPVTGMTQHSIEQPWITGGDFTERLASDVAAGGALLPAIAEAVARLHSIDPAAMVSMTQEVLHSRMPGARGQKLAVPGVNPVAALQSAGNGLTCFLDDLRGHFEDVSDDVLRAIAENPGAGVVSHGDLSADQVVLGEDGSPLLIDFDRMKMAPIGYDLGDFAAVEMLSGRNPATAIALADAYRHVPGAGVVTDESVRAWTAFHVLLRVTEAFRNLDPDCINHARQRIDLAHAVLRGKVE